MHGKRGGSSFGLKQIFMGVERSPSSARTHRIERTILKGLQ